MDPIRTKKGSLWATYKIENNFFWQKQLKQIISFSFPAKTTRTRIFQCCGVEPQEQHYIASRVFPACVQWGIPEKKQPGGQRRGSGYNFLTPLSPIKDFLCFLLHPCTPEKFQTKQGFTPRKSTKLCYTPQKLQGLRFLHVGNQEKIPHDFFLITHGEIPHCF